MSSLAYPRSIQSPASRKQRRRSRSTMDRVLPTIEGLATSTRHAGPDISCWFSRNASRIRRRTRERITDPPTRRLVTNPRRTSEPTPDRCQFSRSPPHALRSPSLFSRVNSREPRNRCARPKLNPRRWPGGATASNLSQALSALAAAIANHAPATPGRHACTESKLAFAPDFRRLILAFHTLKSVVLRDLHRPLRGRAHA